MLAAASLSSIACARQPIAVLDVLRPSVNANTTSFVLYDDGLVIYASRNTDSSHPYLFAKLTKEELTELSPPASLLSLKREYETFPASDVPMYRLLFVAEGHISGIRILGFLRQKRECGTCKLAPLPKPLDEYLGKIVEYSSARAAAWQPQQIQLEIAPENSVRPMLQWPEKWPGVPSAAAIKLKSPAGWYCLNLPGDDWPTLHTLLNRMQRDHTISISGSTWSIVSTHFVLPGERKWDPVGACHSG